MSSIIITRGGDTLEFLVQFGKSIKGEQILQIIGSIAQSPHFEINEDAGVNLVTAGQNSIYSHKDLLVKAGEDQEAINPAEEYSQLFITTHTFPGRKNHAWGETQYRRSACLDFASQFLKEASSL